MLPCKHARILVLSGPFDTPPHGAVCFGDLELQEDDALLISGLGDARMEVLLDLLSPLGLGTPKI
jgi:hypothetical protein